MVRKQKYCDCDQNVFSLKYFYFVFKLLIFQWIPVPDENTIIHTNIGFNIRFWIYFTGIISRWLSRQNGFLNRKLWGRTWSKLGFLRHHTYSCVGQFLVVWFTTAASGRSNAHGTSYQSWKHWAKTTSLHITIDRVLSWTNRWWWNWI